jgi:outer membrane protein assembly factor BamB
LLWTYRHNPSMLPNVLFDEGALSADGLHLYAHPEILTNTQKYYVVSINTATGAEEWRVDTGLSTQSFGGSARHLYVIGNGTILLGGMLLESYGNVPEVVAISATGTLQWKRRFCDQSDCETWPGSWVPGRSGALVFPSKSQAISG